MYLKNQLNREKTEEAKALASGSYLSYLFEDQSKNKNFTHARSIT